MMTIIYHTRAQQRCGICCDNDYNHQHQQPSPVSNILRGKAGMKGAKGEPGAVSEEATSSSACACQAELEELRHEVKKLRRRQLSCEYRRQMPSKSPAVNLSSFSFQFSRATASTSNGTTAPPHRASTRFTSRQAPRKNTCSCIAIWRPTAGAGR